MSLLTIFFVCFGVSFITVFIVGLIITLLMVKDMRERYKDDI